MPLGRTMMDKFNLTSGKPGLGYNASIDASIANNFATAAFRFAHTLIPGIMKLLSNDTSSPEYVQLHKMLLDPFKLYEDGELDKALRGAMNTPIEDSDPFFTNEVSILASICSNHILCTSIRSKVVYDTS